MTNQLGTPDLIKAEGKSVSTANHNVFESQFGYPLPDDIEQLYGEIKMLDALPLVFRFPRVAFVLEIQYMLSVDDAESYDVDNNRLAFAVTGDGFTLLVDLGTEDLQVMQEELGDIDYLGLRIRDLIEAEKSTMS